MDRTTALLAAKVELLEQRLMRAEKEAAYQKEEVSVLYSFIRKHLPFGAAFQEYWERLRGHTVGRND